MCSSHLQLFFSFLFTLLFVFAITRHKHGNSSYLVSLPSVGDRRDSTDSVKKRRIMTVTDESLTEQIERAGDPSRF